MTDPWSRAGMTSAPGRTASRHGPPAPGSVQAGQPDLARDLAGLSTVEGLVPDGDLFAVPVRLGPSGAATAAPTGLPVVGADLTSAAIDWKQVAMYRTLASTRLTAAVNARIGLSESGQQELGRTIILELLDAAAQEDIAAGRQPWTPGQHQRLAVAVHDSLFGLGRLQPLVDDPQIENIEINGCDNVLLEDTDGRLRRGPAVAESDEELQDFLAFLGSRVSNGRPFSPAQPRLHLRLAGGARLAATSWITPRPSVVIRRHRLRVVRLKELVQREMLTEVTADFLAAAVRAKRSIVVSGAQGAGKTTLVRALCAELDPWERIGTFETEYELFLHELTDQHRRVVAWEARPGSGERGPDGRQTGEVTLDDCLYDSFRFNLSRQIVGEVRGREVLAMLKAMQSGAGSISTTHAASASGAIQKLVTCALEAGPQVTVGYAERAVAEHIDLIVQVRLDNMPTPDGAPRRDRYVEEVIAVHPGEDGPARTQVFRPGPGGALPGILPDDYRDLVGHGFDLEGFHRGGRR